ncbi:MAG: VWA domain-containing protein [Acidobacteriota bacterium]
MRSSFAIAVLAAGVIVLSAQPAIKVRVTTVLIEAVVVSNGKLVHGLTREQFEVFEDGRRQQVQYFSEDSDLPVTLGILADEGSRMKTEQIAAVKEFLFRFVHLLKPNDEILLGAFGEDVRMLGPLTSDRTILTRALDEIYLGARKRAWFRDGRWQFSGNSHTGYAVDWMIRKLGAAQHRRRVILVFSNTFGNTGEATEDHLQAAGIFFYTVSFPDATSTVLSLGGDRMAVASILDGTAGASFRFSNEPELARQVAADICSQYNLGYPLAEGKDLDNRNIEVRIAGKDYKVRFRRKLMRP